MGQVKTFIPARLIMGVLTSRPETQPSVRSRLADLFGPIVRETAGVPFLFTVIIMQRWSADQTLLHGFSNELVTHHALLGSSCRPI